MERHVDSRTCRQKQPPAERPTGADGADGDGALITAAIVRKSIVPVAKEDANPALLKRLKQECWGPLTGPVRTGQSKCARVGVSKGGDWADDFAGLSALGTGTCSTSATPIVIECGSEPIIVNLGLSPLIFALGSLSICHFIGVPIC